MSAADARCCQEATISTFRFVCTYHHGNEYAFQQGRLYETKYYIRREHPMIGMSLTTVRCVFNVRCGYQLSYFVVKELDRRTARLITVSR